MKRFIEILMVILVLGSFAPVRANHPWDAEGAKDPPLFNRMPGYYIFQTEEHEFSQYAFPIGKGKTHIVEGRYYYRNYVPSEKAASPLAIIRNYENAVEAIGGQVVFAVSASETVLKVIKSGSEFWAHVKIISADGSAYGIYIVEKQGMEQDIIANAENMARSIKESGRVALYGIFFDSGQADVKPESEPALQEVAKLLKSDLKMKLYVVGHTDNVGGYDANLKLSKERADAVVKALIDKYGVAAARLLPVGVGPVAPVASNQTEDGRAKNRRVELVAQ